MAKKIYVGNLSFNASDEDLAQMFQPYGPVASSRVIKDRFTGRSRGFGFVEIDNNESADKAIAELNGKTVDGRALKVSEAQPRQDGPKQGGGGGGMGFGSGGGGGRRDRDSDRW